MRCAGHTAEPTYIDMRPKARRACAASHGENMLTAAHERILQFSAACNRPTSAGHFPTMRDGRQPRHRVAGPTLHSQAPPDLRQEREPERDALNSIGNAGVVLTFLFHIIQI